jgi:hypothetical protein
VVLHNNLQERQQKVFVGLDIGYGDEHTATSLVDEVSDYVNLIILGSLELTRNTQALTRVCEYIYQKGLYFIVFISFAEEGLLPPRGPDPDFFVEANERWEERFLGVYVFDEPGGKEIDRVHSVDLTGSQTYSEAAIFYTSHLGFFLENTTQYYLPAEFTKFTSDYALYWFDYLAGYDVIFSEYVGENSREIATSLCRGAAKTLNKDWGVMITWSDLDSFVQNPNLLYDDMLLAYQNGAKYIIVFNSPGNFTPPTEYGTLTQQHLDNMQAFWNTIKNRPSIDFYPANIAYVLPRDYGFGFRRLDDNIWGIWEADALSPKILADVNELIQIHGLDLDIVYETKIGNQPIDLPYDRLIFWNGTIIQK